MIEYGNIKEDNLEENKKLDSDEEEENGDREIGDYLNGNKIGKHITLKKNGKISKNKYEEKE